MIRVSVLYPNRPGAKFNHAYYAERHAALVNERLKPLGLLRLEIDKGWGGAGAESPAPFVAAGHLLFSSLENYQKAFAACGEELAGDIPNYTDIEPQIQVSEIVV